jgi:hypothetical protein
MRRQEAVVAYFNASSQNFLKGMKRTMKTPREDGRVLGSHSNPGILRIQNRIHN